MKYMWTDKDIDYVVDEFLIPLANMHLNDSNESNIVALCRKAAEYLERERKTTS